MEAVLASTVTTETESEFADALLEGLTAPSKSIPCRFLYDAVGSALFERITELPEYYPTRTETAILRQRAAEIARSIAPGTALIEFGSGSSRKTELLLAELPDLLRVRPHRHQRALPWATRTRASSCATRTCTWCRSAPILRSRLAFRPRLRRGRVSDSSQVPPSVT